MKREIIDQFWHDYIYTEDEDFLVLRSDNETYGVISTIENLIKYGWVGYSNLRKELYGFVPLYDGHTYIGETMEEVLLEVTDHEDN